VTTIRAAHYGETVDQLKADPIVHAMAAGLAGVPRDELAHPDGTPRHEFMGHANAEYHDVRGGLVYGHIGAVAEALLGLLDEAERKHLFAAGEEWITVAWFHRYRVRPGVELTIRGQRWRVVAIEEAGADGFRTASVEPVE
jgi:hypothetical protein